MLELISCTAFGLLIIVTRGPLIFWPQQTVAFAMETIMATALRSRLLSTVPMAIGAGMFQSTQSTDDTFHNIASVLGVMLLMAGLMLLVIPLEIRSFIEGIVSIFNNAGLRTLGVLSVVIAILWIDLSFVYL